MVVKFEELKTSNLYVNEIYEGGTVSGKGSEVLSKLIPNIPNSRGFRIQSYKGNYSACILYATNKHPEWINSFDPATGIFTYHGDNKDSGVGVIESTKSGMKFLNTTNEYFIKGDRDKIPPIFVFVKGFKGWDVRFIGLAVPGEDSASYTNGYLKEVSTNENGQEIHNYRCKFTILNVKEISREWINDISIGNAYKSAHAPQVWKDWIDHNKYTSLKEGVDSFGLDEVIPENKTIIKETEIKLEKNINVSEYVSKFIKGKGFLYSDQNIKNLYLSLRSKPFVILSGISGTGKTKIVELFAQAVGANRGNGQFKLIPVRPDWSDSSDLIGYKDIKNEFVKGPLTEIIIEASQNQDRPYFVVLDEMNLARVEYYLSDFLSIIESRGWKDGAIETATIVEFVDENGQLQKYDLPENLYIIGTVNMDETTHPFSKKVLDRANSIEFNDVYLTSFGMFAEQREDVQPIQVSNDLFKSDYLFLKDVYVSHEKLVQDVSNELESINEKLKSIYAQVGYRVRDEIVFYMAYNEQLGLLERNEAMDFCIMQKILPRLTGAGDDMREVLVALLDDFTKESIDSKTDFREYKLPEKELPYPKSAKKLHEMLVRLSSQGFVSYWNV